MLLASVGQSNPTIVHYYIIIWKFVDANMKDSNLRQLLEAYIMLFMASTCLLRLQSFVPTTGNIPCPKFHQPIREVFLPQSS